MTTRNLFNVFAALMVLLASCNKDKEEPKPAVTVTADAGSDRTVQVGQTVSLDGSASKDSEGKTPNFSWAFTKKPDGSTVSLTGATTDKPTFAPDVAGEYEVELTASSAGSQDKDKVTVTATGSAVSGVISDDIAADVTLANIVADPAKPDYFVTGDIQVKAKLTVQPGVVIEFDAGRSLYITQQGALVAVGTAADKIVFTGKSKVKGYWDGILVQSSNPLNELAYTEIAYAGNGILVGMSVKASLALYATSAQKGQLKMTHSAISHGEGYGMYVSEGAVLSGFSNNTFSNNTGAALYVPANQVHKLDAASRLTGGNGYNGAEVEGDVKENQEVTWPAFADGSKYLIKSSVNLESGVKIAEGAAFEFDVNKALYVGTEGYLIAKGTATKRISFTGKHKGAGFWAGILIKSFNPLNQMEYVDIAHGGGTHLIGMSVKACLALYGSGSDNASLKLGHSTISYSKEYGLYVDEGAQLREFYENECSHNAGYGAAVPANQVHQLDAASKFSNANGISGVAVEGEVDHNNEVTWPAFADGSKYNVVQTIYLKSGVKINPGASFLFSANQGLYVDTEGHLLARGTEAQKIRFTGVTQTNGYWAGIMIKSASPSNEMDYVEVSYGGGAYMIGMAHKANIALYDYSDAQLKLLHSTITNSGGWGVVAEGAVVNGDIETANTFRNNATGTLKKQ